VYNKVCCQGLLSLSCRHHTLASQGTRKRSRRREEEESFAAGPSRRATNEGAQDAEQNSQAEEEAGGKARGKVLRENTKQHRRSTNRPTSHPQEKKKEVTHATYPMFPPKAWRCNFENTASRTKKLMDDDTAIKTCDQDKLSAFILELEALWQQHSPSCSSEAL
jgi:hypothetical protein